MIIRALTLRNMTVDPPVDTGRIELSDTGEVTVTGLDADWLDNFEFGVRDFTKGGDRLIKMKDGGEFLDAVLHGFSGSHMHFAEIPPENDSETTP